MKTKEDYILALDVGEKRIGAAIAHPVAAIPTPLTTVTNDAAIWETLSKLVEDERVGELVVGLPRDMLGKDTAQTAYVRQFVKDLENHLQMPAHLQDEAVTSVVAEQELVASGKGYNKGSVDAQAAAIILEDYLRERKHA